MQKFCKDRTISYIKAVFFCMQNIFNHFYFILFQHNFIKLAMKTIIVSHPIKDIKKKMDYFYSKLRDRMNDQAYECVWFQSQCSHPLRVFIWSVHVYTCCYSVKIKDQKLCLENKMK